MNLLIDPNAWAALVTLTVLEIVLGIDNLVFISVLTSRAQPKDALRARQIGLSLAFVFRIAMLAGLTWLRSQRSGPTGGNCVEVAFLPSGEVAMRNSRDPGGPALIFTRLEWDAFLGGAGDGEFTTPAP